MNKAAKLEWKQELSEEVFNQIMELSDRHPYYVNLLSGEALEKMGLPLSSAKSAIYVLEEKDFIERRDGEYAIIAPVYKSGLVN